MKPLTCSPRGCARSSFVKLALGLVLASSGLVQAQSLISSSDFFNPDFEARRPGAGGVIALTVDTTLYNPGSQSAGNVTWTHQSGGLVQAGISLVADVQLAAYTQTIGNSLVFGRDLDVNLLSLPDLGGLLTGTVNSVTGASAINSWDSSATVANLSLSEGVLYSASFNVASGAGLNLAALSAANFSLLSGGIPIENINAVETLNVLNLLTIGGGLATIDFQFYAPAGADDLTFEFDAATVANVNLLGTITDNQTVLSFTNFSVAPVPEPGSLALAAVGFMVILRRRRPCGV
ncbi:PEP-CTERM sorting domain-containing protein [Prosthecobacter dejongeii]|uniref:Ice-binding protein C-terminal domain-containing protein n=1 Tax=Prosthecobacter dejongeii TaxID=48465 RepID=A0A7W7YKL5_9BACT|nr:PEP-CTERM sorting domain-containing protein [Prosthecobacter dejongeii]MBB5037650.1 hypothetical protein [Prosthecobacter dejongeii]